MSKVDALLHAFLSAPKPERCIPIDVALTTQLILLDGKYPGHVFIGPLIGSKDTKGILRALKRLEAAGWIIKQERTYIIQPDKLPKG